MSALAIHIRECADALIQASENTSFAKGVRLLRDALREQYAYSDSDIERAAQGLLLGLTNDDAQNGVTALAHMLGANQVALKTRNMVPPPPAAIEAPDPDREADVFIKGRYRVLSSYDSDYEVEDTQTGRRGVYETSCGGGFRAGMRIRSDGYQVDSLGHLETGWRM